MTSRDWDKELAKIDKRISRMSDAELTQGVVAGAAPGSAPESVSAKRSGGAVDAGTATPTIPTMWSIYVRAGLSTALAVSVPFWPYAARCGLGLGAYLIGIAAVIAAGGWTALASWRARAGRVHVLALTLIAWGLSLAAVEVLPRIGYGKDAARVTWLCK